MFLNNCLIIDVQQLSHIPHSVIQILDFLIVREENGKYTFCKNRYNGIEYSDLTEYELNNIIMGMTAIHIPEKKE